MTAERTRELESRVPDSWHDIDVETGTSAVVRDQLETLGYE